MLKTATRYRVTITADGARQYKTSGAISITASQRPMVDAAKALLARGADPADKLSGAFEGAAISPMTLARLARAYSPPRTDHRARDVGRNCD